MKRKLIIGMLFIGAAALSSCSTTNKIASQNNNNDDVYYSRATAGEAPEYVPTVATQPEEGYADDDYYYYGDYASRINRFDYYSPFDYCDGFYGYSPYNRLGFGLSFGLGYSYGYNYSPYGYGYSPYGYGYSTYYGGYNNYGVGYGGYGGYYNGGSLAGNNPRPYRGSGSPGTPVNYRGQRIGYASAATARIGYYPGRAVNRVGVNSTGGSANGRPSRTATYDSRQQVSTDRYQPPSNSNNNSSGRSSSSSSGSSSSGGGGGRPVRP